MVDSGVGVMCHCDASLCSSWSSFVVLSTGIQTGFPAMLHSASSVTPPWISWNNKRCRHSCEQILLRWIQHWRCSFHGTSSLLLYQHMPIYLPASILAVLFLHSLSYFASSIVFTACFCTLGIANVLCSYFILSWKLFANTSGAAVLSET